MVLTPEQVWLFRVSGFVKLPQDLPAETVQALRAAIQHDIEQRSSCTSVTPRRTCAFPGIDRAPIFRDVATGLLSRFAAGPVGPTLKCLQPPQPRHPAPPDPAPRCCTARASGAGYRHGDLLPDESTARRAVLVSAWQPSPALGAGHAVMGRNAGGLGLLKPRSERRCRGGCWPLIASSGMAGGNRTGETRTSMTTGYHSVDDLATVETCSAYGLRRATVRRTRHDPECNRRAGRQSGAAGRRRTDVLVQRRPASIRRRPRGKGSAS
jgi:hypothetical protein